MPSNKRPYGYITRKRRSSGASQKADRWISEMETLDQEDLRACKCCKTLKCFEKCNINFLREKMIRLRAATTTERRRALYEMLGSSGNFLFDGAPVCSNILQIAFRFSRDLQLSVRTGTASSALSLPVLQTTVQTGGESDQKDAVFTFLERIAENSGDVMPDRTEMHLPFLKKV